MEKKELYQKKMQAKLSEWQADIKKLEAKADMAAADSKLELKKQVEDLKAMTSDAERELDKLRTSGEDAWDDLKAGVDAASDSLGTSIRDAVARFK